MTTIILLLNFYFYVFYYTPRPTMDLLSSIRAAQNQYGLRYDDFARYRRHCTKKIYRLRTLLDFHHGKGTHFEKRSMDGGAVGFTTTTTLDFLWLLVYETERAYAFAMEAKAQSVMEPRKKFIVHKKLKRAAQYARLLEELSTKMSMAHNEKQPDDQGQAGDGQANQPAGDGKPAPVAVVVDARSLLEIQAYAAWLEALFAFETQRWLVALDHFAMGRTMYRQLADTGNAEQEALCESRIDDMDPNIRYCVYNLQRQGQDLGDITTMDTVDEMVTKRTRGRRSLDTKVAVCRSVERTGGARGMGCVRCV